MTKQDILNVVDTEGMIWTAPYMENANVDLVFELEQEGILASATSEGITFMNGDYCYVRKGNPLKIVVKTSKQGNESWLEKS